MENILVSPETQKFLESASDREVQNQIYVTLRKVEFRERQVVSRLTTLATIAVIYLICTAIVVIEIIQTRNNYR